MTIPSLLVGQLPEGACTLLGNNIIHDDCTPRDQKIERNDIGYCLSSGLFRPLQHRERKMSYGCPLSFGELLRS